ncbi:MAG: hypothetical protein ABIR34_10640 [Marmoricola sp.]
MKFRGQPSKRARVWAAPSAALALLLLTGCGEITPGTAAVVNGSRITNDDVNDLAAAQCVAADRAAKSGNSTAMAISKVKQQSLGLLMDTELSLQYAKDQDIVPEKTLAKGFYNQLEPGITPLPGKARAVLTDVFATWAQGRAILVTAGSKSTGQEPSFTNLDQLISAGLQDRTTWMKGAKIETDPRYAPSKGGFPGGGDGSVSRAGSTFAKGARSAKPDPKFVAGLPASQKCG